MLSILSGFRVIISVLREWPGLRESGKVSEREARLCNKCRAPERTTGASDRDDGVCEGDIGPMRKSLGPMRERLGL